MANLEKGEALLNESLRLYPEIPVRVHLAQILRFQGKLQQARKQLEMAQQADAKHVWFLNIEQELEKIIQAEQENHSGDDSPNTPSGSRAQP